MHHDASEVTLNVCLGREFSGARLQFCGRFGSSDHRVASASHSHSIGCAVLHLGRQRHGADAIATGERLNLIVWARSSAFRGAAAFGWLPPDGYPKDREGDGAIDEVCLSKANDDDYEETVELEVNESILELANKVLKNTRDCSLGWHYRSRHNSLIDFSNKNFYNDELTVFPANKIGSEIHLVPVENPYYHQRRNF